MAQPTKLAVIVDPMRARIHRYDAQGQELVPQRIVFRAPAENLLTALGEIVQKKADLANVAADFREQGAQVDMQQFAHVLANRVRAVQSPEAALDLAVLVAPEMAEVVSAALHPAVRLFHKIPVAHLSEASINDLLTEWLYTKNNTDGTALE